MQSRGRFTDHLLIECELTKTLTGKPLSQQCSSQSCSVPHSFLPVTRLSEGTLTAAADKMDDILRSPHQLLTPSISKSARIMIDSAKNVRQVPTLSCDSQENFQAIWAERLPLVVNGLENKLQGAWDPMHFTQAHGDLGATMLQATWTPTGSDPTSEIDGVEDVTESTVTVREFFNLFTKDNQERGTIVKLKVCFWL